MSTAPRFSGATILNPSVVNARPAISTTPMRVHGGAELDARIARGEPVVLAFWHAELYACVMHLRARFAAVNARLVFLVSPSIDGDLVTRIVELGGGQLLRGAARVLVRVESSGPRAIPLPEIRCGLVGRNPELVVVGHHPSSAFAGGSVMAAGSGRGTARVGAEEVGHAEDETGGDHEK
jgi:hypothetical protein